MSRRVSFAAFVCGMEGHEHFKPERVVLTKHAAEEWLRSRVANHKQPGFVMEWPKFYPAPLVVSADAREVLDAVRETKK